MLNAACKYYILLIYLHGISRIGVYLYAGLGSKHLKGIRSTIMKKIIALTALTLAGSVFAQTTSTGELSVSQKSFKDRVGFWYYGELTKKNAANDNIKPDADFLNYINTSYEISDSLKTNFTLRMNLTDANDENGKGDRFQELDPRLGIDYNRDGIINRWRAVVELPTSKGAQQADKIGRLKLYLFTTGKKIDDYNTVGFIGNYNKDFFQDPAARNKTSQYYLTQYFTWTNTSVSEIYRPKVELELLQTQIAGASDLDFEASKGDERLLAGVDTDLLGVNFYPYLYHDISKVKAADQLGVGMQIFKDF